MRLRNSVIFLVVGLLCLCVVPREACASKRYAPTKKLLEQAEQAYVNGEANLAIEYLSELLMRDSGNKRARYYWERIMANDPYPFGFKPGKEIPPQVRFGRHVAVYEDFLKVLERPKSSSAADVVLAQNDVSQGSVVEETVGVDVVAVDQAQSIAVEDNKKKEIVPAVTAEQVDNPAATITETAEGIVSAVPKEKSVATDAPTPALAKEGEKPSIVLLPQPGDASGEPADVIALKKRITVLEEAYQMQRETREEECRRIEDLLRKRGVIAVPEVSAVPVAAKPDVVAKKKNEVSSKKKVKASVAKKNAAREKKLQMAKEAYDQLQAQMTQQKIAYDNVFAMMEYYLYVRHHDMGMLQDALVVKGANAVQTNRALASKTKDVDRLTKLIQTYEENLRTQDTLIRKQIDRITALTKQPGVVTVGEAVVEN